MLFKFEQSEEICFEFISENIKEIISGAHKHNRILIDCINPTETLLEEIQDILMEKEVR